LIEAGLKPSRVYKRDPERMLKELAALMNDLSREPKQTEINSRLNYNSHHYILQFGSLQRAFDLAEERLNLSSSLDESTVAPLSHSLARTHRRRRYGQDIQFRGLRHAPVNENGVVFLFGMVAEELGFEVENVQSGFPDCEAKRRRSDGTFERVSIELEFKSSEFVRHGHDANQCDVLVCWEHDWEKCPRALQVIELKSLIGKLKP